MECLLCHFKSCSTILKNRHYYHPHFFKWRNWNPDKINNLLKSTQLIRGRMQTYRAWPKSPYFQPSLQSEKQQWLSHLQPSVVNIKLSSPPPDEGQACDAVLSFQECEVLKPNDKRMNITIFDASQRWAPQGSVISSSSLPLYCMAVFLPAFPNTFLYLSLCFCKLSQGMWRNSFYI